MASIFTYGTDQPRVASPWLYQISSDTPSRPNSRTIRSKSTPMNIPGTPPPGLLTDYNVTKLEPEPQEGPIEFKLHLLLRPRRTYSSTSTGFHIAGSQQQLKQLTSSPRDTAPSSPATAPSKQMRQNRLEHLTTQLLWRLQQSSPYHGSLSSELVIPLLPESEQSLSVPSRPGKLLAGLEASRGALYEIGVSDDGTFVGLTEDEMEESLVNLRAMAASLGCVVEVTKMVVVGDCEWQTEDKLVDRRSDLAFGRPCHNGSPRQQAQLWVAEALVTPDLSQKRGRLDDTSIDDISALNIADSPRFDANVQPAESTPPALQAYTEQLRVTLTGPTTSGKSSLLGTLSTATLDNGRGKSRLSLLKHLHELHSGVTSSVAQELFGYRSREISDDIAIVNYAVPDVSSWNDIHATAEDGRLVFVSDSAGHPRYRRTTVRGLVGWAPHWTMLCVAADEGEKSTTLDATASSQDILGAACKGVDFSKAHLDLCLKLDQPLVIVITKFDLARSSVRQSLAKILSAIKGAARIPALLPPDQSKNITASDLETISASDMIAVDKVVSMMDKNDLLRVVPIIMTSSLKGTGIRQLHALLHSLPIPATPTARDYVNDALNPEQPACLYHIEDIFGLPASYAMQTSAASQLETGSVVAGHLRFGSLAIGDKIVVGPFPSDSDDSTPPTRSGGRTPPARQTNDASDYESFLQSHSHPSTSELVRIGGRNERSAAVTAGEWHTASIISIRNLRLPVHTLTAGQVGTIGIVFDPPDEPELSNGPFERPPPRPPRMRKGMVLAVPSQHMLASGHSLQAASGFTASFEDGDVNSVTVGSLVVIYIASIRAAARVVRLAPHVPVSESLASSASLDEGDDDVFGFDEPREVDQPAVFGRDGVTDVTLELMTNREWIELGSQVLIMPGGGAGLGLGSVKRAPARGEKGVAGLEGFVGRIIEVVD